VKNKRATIQLFSYLTLGSIGAAIDSIIFLALSNSMFDPISANIISTLIGILTSYILNARFTFRQSWSLRNSISFITVGLIGLLLSTLLIWFLISILHMSTFYGKMITLPVVAILQYTLNKKYTFATLQPAKTKSRIHL
jgi:putative flippase GtrA